MNFLEAFEDAYPELGADVFIAETARLIGSVTLGSQVNVWYGAVLRGDVGTIVVGARSNIQDLACVHMTGGVSNVLIGDDVTVGHGAIIHGAKVGDGALIGMGSILLDNAEIGPQTIIGAGALVTPNTKIPPRSLVLGNPGRVIRQLSDAELQTGKLGAEVYLGLSASYRKRPKP
jgi:carbonic anhydrase/acetyltransferase-like protein (isoleucine patch superfamily)